MNALLQKIHGRDIYRDYAVAHAGQMKSHLYSWGGKDPLFREMVEKVRPDTILEIGTFMGQSAITMAEACRDFGLKTTVVCVDPWTGNASHYRIPKMREELMIQYGFPRIYEQFLANVILAELQDMIVPVPLCSLEARELLAEHGVESDLTYIDGSHQYPVVLADIRTAMVLRKPGTGVVFGHDALRESVVTAVGDFCKQRGSTFVTCGDRDNFWILEGLDYAKET